MLTGSNSLFWKRLRWSVGFVVLVGVVIFGLLNAPRELFDIKIPWLLVALLSVLVSAGVQVVQFKIYLKAHSLSDGWNYPALFTCRKGLLNSVFPAKSGTLLLLHLLKSRYGVTWHSYILFSLTNSLVALLSSAAGVVGIFYGPVTCLVSVALLLLILVLIRHCRFIPFGMVLLPLAVTSGALIGSFAMALWGLINGLGFPFSGKGALTAAVLLNTLAQVSVTPGNIGIRELLLGAFSPMLGLPMSIAYLAGAGFFTVRLVILSVLLLLTEICLRNNNVVRERA